MDETALEQFFHRIPEAWEELVRDKLTAIENELVLALVEFGLVELRARVRFRCSGEPAVFLATITRTGADAGIAEAGKILKLAFLNDWKGSACKVERGEKPAWMENAGPEFWRLTARGKSAKDYPEETEQLEFEPAPATGRIDDIEIVQFTTAGPTIDQTAERLERAPSPSQLIEQPATEAKVPIDSHLQVQASSEAERTIDPVEHGIALLTAAHLAKEKVTVKSLADKLGITRQALYQTAEFEQLRNVARKLFGLFSEKGTWNGPSGAKDKEGNLEAEDYRD